jgi:hypothetical protein
MERYSYNYNSSNNDHSNVTPPLSGPGYSQPTGAFGTTGFNSSDYDFSRRNPARYSHHEPSSNLNVTFDRPSTSQGLVRSPIQHRPTTPTGNMPNPQNFHTPQPYDTPNLRSRTPTNPYDQHPSTPYQNHPTHQRHSSYTPTNPPFPSKTPTPMAQSITPTPTPTFNPPHITIPTPNASLLAPNSPRHPTPAKNTVTTTGTPTNSDLPNSDFSLKLFKIIEEFRDKSQWLNSESDIKKIAKLVLTKDVLNIYCSKSEVEGIMIEKIEAEKKKIGDTVDQVLKEIIVLMDSVKDLMVGRLVKYSEDLFGFRDLLWSQMDRFLGDTVDLILRSDQMSEYEKVQKSLVELDPIGAEIDVFRIKREQATEIEGLFKQIRENYNSTKINELKTLLSSIIEPETRIFREKESLGYFKKMRQNLRDNWLENNAEFKKDNFVNELDIQYILNLLSCNLIDVGGFGKGGATID